MAFGDYATLRSDFTGANEDPLSEGGNWAEASGSTGDLQRNTNEVKESLAGVTGRSYWTPTQFTDSESWVTITAKPGNGNTIDLITRLKEPGSGWDGYLFRFAQASGTDTWDIFRIVNGSSTATIDSGSREFANGEKIGALSQGTTHSIYVFTGGSWTLLGGGTDNTYTSGYLGIGIRSTTGRIDDFFAGEIVVPGTPGPARFAGPTVLGTGAATLFTSSGDSLVEMVHVSNPTGSPVDLTMSLGADAAGTRFIDGLAIPADSERKFRFYLPLADSEIVQAFAGTGSALVVTVDGQQL